MKGGYRYGLGLLIAVIVLIALIQASQKQPVDWRKTYNPKDKIPFGTYVIRQELKNIFKNNRTFLPIEQSLYTYFNKDSVINAQGEQDFIYIGNNFHPGKAALKNILTFVHNGNIAFLATQMLPSKLRDTLHLKVRFFNSYQAGISYNKDSVYYTLAAGGISARFDKSSYPNFYSKLNDSTTTILGYLKIKHIQLPNFIKVKFGKGYFFCQLTPDVYSNYFMLNAETYPLAYESLHHLNGKHILWYDGLYNADAPRTPLRFILSQPSLRSAWYLLLITLLLYLIFKGKREQKAISIVEPEQNLSVAFAETIGSLYYENGQPANMLEKKIRYFLYFLKKEYKFDTIAIEQPLFRQQAEKRLHIPIEKMNTFFDQLIHYQKLTEPTLTDLKKVQNLIEDFKQKIK